MASPNIFLCLALYLGITSYMAYGKSNAASDDGKVDFISIKESVGSSERRFIGHLKRWIFGRKPEQAKAETKVKYLPVYVPVPIYSEGGTPINGEYYGAPHYKKNHVMDTGDIVFEVQTQGHRYHPSTRRGSHYGPMRQFFDRQSIPYYLQQFGNHLTHRNNAYHHQNSLHDNGAYEYSYDNDLDEEFVSDPVDSVVIDNPDFIADSGENGDVELYLRKRRKHRRRT